MNLTQPRAIVVGFTLLAAGSAIAADTAAARPARDRHMGVASCAGSACHGAATITGSNVRQNEYLRWQRDDAHARAYASLRSERSRRIAANLGLRDAATAPECLACHADAVPAAEQGERHHVSDGVGCEACHGASERWLSGHVRGYRSHAERLAAGLYPTWDYRARAELCLSCHLGSAERPMTHRIMGAGHPPLLFELDTFVTLQPAHFEADADYAVRKGKPDDARLWIAGQAVAARGLLAGVGGPALGQGLFPELAWFDCNACHHSLQALRWEPRAGGAPGRVRLADSALHFTALWLDVVQPTLAARWREAIAQLHEASGRDAAALRAGAAAASQLLESEVLPLAASHAHTPTQLRALALQVADQGAARAGDFSVAEQTAMATAVFATALGQATGARAPKALQGAIDEVYAAVEHRDRYEPARLRAALGHVREQVARAYAVK